MSTRQTQYIDISRKRENFNMIAPEPIKYDNLELIFIGL
jgi:hypothetical protein